MTTHAKPGVPTPAGRSRVPRLLRQAQFRRYWSAQTISLFGDQVSLLAVPLLAVLALGAGPAQMGYLTAAGLIPNLLLPVVAGAWVDTYPHKRRLMIIADLGRAALLAVVPVLWWTGTLALPQLYVVAFLVGTLAVLFEVAHASLFVALVDKPDYVEANTLLNGSRAASFVVGPSIGGVLIQALTAPIAVLVDAVSYVASALFLTRIRAVEPPAAPRQGLGVTVGLRYLANSAILRSLLLGTTTINLFNYMFAALFVLYATAELGISAGVLGAIIGASSVGALIGAAVTGRLSRRIGIGPTLVVSFVLFPAPLMLVPLAGGPDAVILAMIFTAEFLSALGVMMLDITVGSVQIAATAETMLARVQGAKRTVNYGIRPIGALIGGALGTAIGVRPALWIATAGAVTGVLWVLGSPAARLHQLPDSEPVRP